MRKKPIVLQKLETLDSRMVLTEKSRSYLKRLLRGYEGECIIDRMLEQYENEIIILKDLYLSGINTSHIQIDTLLISRGKILLLEVKNYEGTYTSRGNSFMNSSGFEFQNPKVQVNKAESILKSILSGSEFSSYSIEPIVVYPHDNFKLLQADTSDLHFSLDNLRFYISKNLYTNNGITENDQRVANFIKSRVKMYEHTHELIPEYSFETLNKRMSCPDCRQEMREFSLKTFKCNECSKILSKSEVLEFNTKEYQILFDTIPTYKELSDWTGNLLYPGSYSRAITNYRKKLVRV